MFVCRLNFVTKAQQYIKDVADISKRNQHASSYQQQQQQHQQQSQQNSERYNLLSSSIDERSPQTVTSHVLKPLSVVFSFNFVLKFYFQSQLDFILIFHLVCRSTVHSFCFFFLLLSEALFDYYTYEHFFIFCTQSYIHFSPGNHRWKLNPIRSFQMVRYKIDRFAAFNIVSPMNVNFKCLWMPHGTKGPKTTYMKVSWRICCVNQR